MTDKKSIERPLNLALRYLSHRPRTAYEMRVYLKKKGVDENTAEKTINYLLEKNFLNDKDYASLYIESKVRNKPRSKFAFQYELKKKGVDVSIIEKILVHFDDQDLAIKCVHHKTKQWQTLDKEHYKKKMMNFLRYKGFNYDICLSTLNHFLTKKDIPWENQNEN